MMNTLKAELWSCRIPYRNECSITTKILQSKLNRKVCEIGNVEVEGLVA